MQTLTAQQLADRMMTSQFSDGRNRTIDPGSDGRISVNLTDLTAGEQSLARRALTELSTMTGLRFGETTGRADITYRNDGTGAHTSTTGSGSHITRATVEIASSRVGPGDSYGSYAYRTYMHETAHALGLGHPQDYGRVKAFSQSGIANDSWQMSMMSYFDQDENTRVDATKAYNLTPMLADYLALRQMYGAPAVHADNTTYGVGSNAGGALDAAAMVGARAAFLIADHGGTDHVNFSNAAADQRINLIAGELSSVMGAVNNMHIAPDSIIEHATGGQGNDTLIGNQAANRLTGGAGQDRISDGAAGDDTLDGGAGNDRLVASAGNDVLIGGAGNDTMSGGAGHDRMSAVSGTNLMDGGDGNDALTGGVDADRLLGGAGSDTLNGQAGSDQLVGGDGGDRLYGLDGSDSLDGGAGHDMMIGGSGNDTLRGGAGNDDLAAQTGRDVLDGGAGNDLLRGGDGGDQFIFSDGTDTIRNFDRAEDRIDLRGLPGIDSWSDLRSHLTQAGNHVELRMGDDMLRIEWTRLGDLTDDHFVW